MWHVWKPAEKPVGAGGVVAGGGGAANPFFGVGGDGFSVSCGVFERDVTLAGCQRCPRMCEVSKMGRVKGF